MSLFHRVAFLKSANALKDLPPDQGIEIAFAGRSNAGKSSALNTLCNRKVAFVSKTPGRTQLINYFDLGDDRFLVDLPGYGYAQVPEAIRMHWRTVLSQYLMTRRVLYGLVLIMDARHPMTPLDKQMLDWFLPTGKPVHVLLTKADKLSRNEAANTLNKVRKMLNEVSTHCSVQLFSSSKRQGVEEAEKVIATWLAIEPALAKKQ